MINYDTAKPTSTCGFRVYIHAAMSNFLWRASMAFAPGSLDTDSQRDQFQGLKRERKRAKERERERERENGELVK